MRPKTVADLVVRVCAIVISAKKVVFSSTLVSLFVCQQEYAKTTQPIFTKFGEKVTHGPRKKSIDFGGNPDHVALGLELGLNYDYL